MIFFFIQELREKVKAEAIGMHLEPLPFSFAGPSYTEQPNFTSDDFEGTSKIAIYVNGFYVLILRGFNHPGVYLLISQSLYKWKMSIPLLGWLLDNYIPLSA